MTSTGEPRPIIPALGPFYDKTRDLSWLVVRCTAGGILLVHGLDKVLNRTIAAFASGSLARRGIDPAIPLLMRCSSCTRSLRSASSSACSHGFSPAIGIQFLLIIYAHWAPGFGWNRPGGGWEYPLFWGLIWLAIGLRGGGPYSLDRKLGREL